MPSADDGVGPAFDTMTLSRPTTRKLVGGWMCEAHEGGEGSEQLLVLALATIAPDIGTEWSVDGAFADLQRLRNALRGAALPTVADRLENRWECDRGLDRLVASAREVAANSPTLRFERRWR